METKFDENRSLLFDKISGARDQFGVLTKTAMESQLQTLTPADWQAASQLFSRDKANGGFFIDDEFGKVSIHNDQKEVTNEYFANHIDTDRTEAITNGIAAGVGTITAIAAHEFLGPWASVAIGGLATAGVELAGRTVEQHQKNENDQRWKKLLYESSFSFNV